MKNQAGLLIVDDDAINLKTYSKFFRDVGYRVETATSSEETFHALKEQVPDLILLDIMLGHESGLDILHTIKNDPQYKYCYVVLITGHLKDSDDQARGLELGADGYLTRPIDKRQLLARIETFIRHKKTIDELRRSEEKFKKIIEKNPDAMLIVDEEGVVRFANPAAETLFSVPADDLVNSFFGLPNVLDEHSEINIFRRADHRDTIGEMRTIDIEWEDKHAMLVSIRDITDRKHGEEALRESESKFRQLVESLEEGIWQIDADGSTVYVNPKIVSLLGYSAEEMIGKDLFAFMDKARITGAERDLRICKDGTSQQYEVVFQKKNGEPVETHFNASPIADEDGRYLGALASVVDMTERNRMHRALKNRERFLNYLLDAIPIPVFFKDVDLQYLGCNKAFEVFFKSKREHLIGKTVYDIHPKDLADVYQNSDLELLQQGGIQQYEFRVRNARGESHDVEFHKALFYDENNRIGGVIGAIIDLTELKQKTAGLELLNERLRQLSDHLQNVREEERTRLARELHDDLWQSMTALNIDIIKIGRIIDDCTVKTILNGMKRIIKSVDDSLQRMQVELRPGLLDDLGLTAACEWHTKHFEHNSNIVCSLTHTIDDANIPTAVATTLFRALQESLSNIEKHAGATHVDVTLESQNGFICMTVKDNGIGIKPADHDVKGAFGLLSMRERISMLNGSVTVTGLPDKGTTVVVAIPLPSDKQLPEQ